MGLNQSSRKKFVSIGVFQNGDTEITGVGFSPRYIQFWGLLHSNLGQEEDFTGTLSYSMGYSDGTTQVVGGQADNSDGVNAHYQVFETGNCVYLIGTSNQGASRDGALVGNVASFNDDGFTMNYSEDSAGTAFIGYRAFR